jgi:hypothetical protein
MLALAAVRKVVVGGAGDRVVVQSLGEVWGLDDEARLGVELDTDLLADRDTRGLPVGVAEAEQVAAA